MVRRIDLREPRTNRASRERAGQLRALASSVSDALPGEQRIRIARLDSRTGNPSAIIAESTPAEQGSYVQRALDFLQTSSRALGLTPSQPTEFAVDPQPLRTSSDAITVHAQQ